ncbi:hypothetical protein OSSY52_04160 [Tepiditoga spiralis]|uniref:AdoMet activation domain-containing protein n=1 Tax=Tepiditoga spiralis TaxID=2108365 RepID=A0A7G1G2X6_9BACT|nr:vitamin B12 dependent-methionine synthase activation domain-containing protein [Tepiditoga spiralis]BBE30275.1 hypothetical protein OSSY52_04160 [Tepiditoga spiralis]
MEFKKEVLRYLGYKNQKIDNKLDFLIDKSIEEVKNTSIYRYTFKIFDLEKLKEGILLSGTEVLLKGENIKTHLRASDKCAIMAVTIGFEIDKKLRYYQLKDMTKAVIFNACASVYVEKSCDEVQSIIEKEMYPYYITPRYSPGYGDFSIEVQQEIVNILDTRKKIGLDVTENNVLIPEKSVTAIIGLQKENSVANIYGCDGCKLNCSFKRKGGSCAY